MIHFYKLALGPLLLVQGRAARRAALRLPEASGPRAGVVSPIHSGEPFGEPFGGPLRMLFVGDSSAAGVGVAHQCQALAMQSAQRLAEKIARPVAWQLIAKSGANTRDTWQMVADQDLAPADVVITVLGVNDVTSQCSRAQFIRDYKVLMALLRHKTGARFAVVNGVPPFEVLRMLPQPLRWYLARHAARLDAVLRDWVCTVDEFCYLSLRSLDGSELVSELVSQLASDGYHPGAAQYRQWAEQVATSAAALFTRRSALAAPLGV